MKTAIILLSIIISFNSYSQTNDLGFEQFAKAVKIRSEKIQSNRSEISSIVEQVQEVYEDKLDEGCDSDFIDLFTTKFNKIIEKVNTGVINITEANGVDNFRFEMYSLKREINRYNCSQKSVYSSATKTVPNNTIKTGKVRLRTMLWSDCDVEKRKFISFVDTDTIVNIMSFCENKIKNQYFVILENGKGGYISCDEIN